MWNAVVYSTVSPSYAIFLHYHFRTNSSKMSLSDESIAKFEDVQYKRLQYAVFKIENLYEPVPQLEVESTGEKGASFAQFLKDFAKDKECRFGVFSYVVQKKSHPIIFYWTPHDAESSSALIYTKTNRELKKTNWKGITEIHATDMAQLDETFVTSKLEDIF